MLDESKFYIVFCISMQSINMLGREKVLLEMKIYLCKSELHSTSFNFMLKRENINELIAILPLKLFHSYCFKILLKVVFT
jgi:hypothetical protein